MDCYLPADFFLADDAQRATRGDYELGADAHVHLDAPAFVTGLRDWAKPRGEYPRRRPSRGVRQAHPERVRSSESIDSEWRPL